MYLVLVYLVGAALCAVLSRLRSSGAGWLAAGLAGAGAIFGLRLLLQGPVAPELVFESEEQMLQVSFQADALAAIGVSLLGVVGLVGALASLLPKVSEGDSLRRATQGGEERDELAPPLLLFGLAASTGAVLAGELLTYYALALLLSLGLVAYLSATGREPTATLLFMGLEVPGLAMLAVIWYLRSAMFTLGFTDLLWIPDLGFLEGAGWMFAGMAVALAARAGLAPLYVWVTGASRTLSPASACWVLALPMLVGLLGLVRNWGWVSRLQPDWEVRVLPIVGGLTILLGAYAALHQSDVRRMAAFLTVSQAGYVAMAVGSQTGLGAQAAAIQLLAVALTGPLLFLALGRLGEALERPGPQEGLSFGVALLGALAAMAAPPSVGFVARWLLVQDLAQDPATGLWLLAATLLASGLGVLVVLGLLQRLARAGVSFGPVDAENIAFPTLAMALLVALAFGLGLSPSLLIGEVAVPATTSFTLFGEEMLGARATVWTVVLTLVGLGLGLVLFWVNEASVHWRRRWLGIQQVPEAQPEDWWLALERWEVARAIQLALTSPRRP